MTILRRQQVQERTGLSRSTIYDWLSTTSPRFDPNFPQPIELGANSVGWLSTEIDAWIAQRISVSRSSK
jgi:prophage regulatory protein